MAKKDKKDQVTYEIVKVYLFLNEDETKVFCRVAWNGGEPRDEVRTCWRKDGKLKLGKGIPLSASDITNLYNFIDMARDDFEDEEDESDCDKPTVVDFDSLFASSMGIMEKREAGYQTVDGFIDLRRKGM